MWVILPVASVLLLCTNGENQVMPIQFCGDFKPQLFVDIDNLLGRWYAVQMIFHAKEESDQVQHHEVCPVIELEQVSPDYLMSEERNADNWKFRRENPENLDKLMEPLVKVWRDEVKSEKEYSRRRSSLTSPDDFTAFKKQTLQRLHLVWHELQEHLNYSLRYNTSKPGYWMSFGSQNGYENHKPFVGTIQVLRAVHSHMILTFCHISEEHQFYTVILARKPDLSKQEMDSIHGFIERKHLGTRHIRHMCKEFAEMKIASSSEGLSVYKTFAVVLSLVILVWYSTVG